MEKTTLIKIYEVISYILILGATVFFFVAKDFPMRASVTLLVIVLALFFRNMMSRTRLKMVEEENEELRVDLRRLTNLLELAKKEKNSTDNNQNK